MSNQTELDKSLDRIQQYMVDQGYWIIDPKSHRALALCLRKRKLEENNQGVLIIGRPGTGKTLWLKLFSRPGNSHVYTTEELIEIYTDDSKDFRERMRPNGGAVCSKNHADIAIDDMGQEPSLNDYGTKVEIMEQAVYLRYRSFKILGARTFISTNLKIDQIAARYGDRTASRLLEMCDIVTINSKDQRTV